MTSRSTVAAVLACLVLGGGALAYSCRTTHVGSVTTHGGEPILPLLGSAEHHDRVLSGRHAPYVLRIDDPSGGSLLYFGARHTKDFDDPQIEAISSAWDSFSPTLALLEGRLGYGLGGARFAVQQFGEPGLVYALARRDDVEVYSIEPDALDQARALADATDREAAAAMLTMRFVWSNSPRPYSDAVLEAGLSKRAIGVLDGVFADAEAFDRFWRARWLGELGDWRELSDERMIPRRGRTELEQVWAIDTELRDEHMTRVLVEKVRAGERVFAVIGRSHVPVQEPALRALLPQATVTAEFLPGEWGQW